MKPIGIKGSHREVTSKMGISRLICEECGLSRNVPAKETEDFEFWYAANFRGNRIWAVNKEHLSLLIDLFSGKIRKTAFRRASSVEHSHFGTRVMVESFPKWMVLAKNRHGILKCLTKMSET